MDIKLETIEMLRTIKLSSHSATLDGKEATVIDNVSEDSFLWVINQAIALIKDGKPDYKDI